MDAWRTKFGKDSMQIKTKNKKTRDNCFSDAFTIEVKHSSLSKLDKTYQ